MITTYTLDADALDRIAEDDLLEILGVDLHDVAADAEHTAYWLDAEGDSWALPTYALQIGSRVVLWTRTDEAGVDDVDIVEAEDDLTQQVKEYAESLASGLGTLADLGTGEHYSQHGVQYEWQAPGSYDRDGYRVIITPRTV